MSLAQAAERLHDFLRPLHNKDRTRRITHTNRSPINPGWFNVTQAQLRLRIIKTLRISQETKTTLAATDLVPTASS